MTLRSISVSKCPRGEGSKIFEKRTLGVSQCSAISVTQERATSIAQECAVNVPEGRAISVQ